MGDAATADVLVVPQRVAPRLQDLHADEVSDLFLSAQRIGNVIERVFHGQSLTIACQVRLLLGDRPSGG
jgi:bis(5'-adenosyl)-triphosphatase